MAAKGKAKKARPAAGGGTLMGMRDGFRRVAGAGGAKRKKKPVTMVTVLFWSFLVAAAIVLVWRLSV